MHSAFIHERIDEFLEKEKKCNKNLLNQLTLYIYALESIENENDTYLLAKLLPPEILIRLISYYDGDSLKLPTKEQFSKAYLVAIAMYLKEILEYDWVKIKKLLNLPENEKDSLSSISIGRRINTIKAKFNNDIHKLLNNLDIEDEQILKLRREVENELYRK